MTLTPNQKLHGFTVTRVRPCQDLRGTLVEMTHDRTGAQLCWLDSGLPNKLFSITFMTLPEDDTGVFHILEHSTLCGSAKYPVREPFVELLKSSMNTFLNAMTGADFTTYPVSSRNTQDYLNLVSIYLDAVFAPQFLQDPNIFYQEGWHIETDPRPAYKGVVFNEMKGAMSGVSRVIDERMDRMLYPDTCYAFNSGGNPEKIPTLTYNRFLEMYRRFYHPSNARVFLDGDVPLEETLQMLEEYFSRYERQSVPGIAMQVPRACRDEIRYELDPGEDIKDKGRLSIGKIVGTWQDRTKILAVDLLMTALLDHNESPLMKAVLDSGLAQSVDYEIVDDAAQSSVRLLFKDVKDGQEEALLALVTDTARQIAEEGIDRQDLEAALSRTAFAARQAQEPAGLMHQFRALSTWLYGGDPMEGLSYTQLLESVWPLFDGRGMEELLQEILCNPEGRATLVARPSQTLGAERQDAENLRLDETIAAWIPTERQENEDRVAALVRWQATEDTPAQLATIPRLHLKDVGEMIPSLGTKVLDADGVKVLYHPGQCPGLVHIGMYFSLSDLSEEELPRVQLMARLLGDLPTKNHSVPELARLLGLHVGDYGISIQATADGQTEKASVRLAVSMSVLEEHLEAALDLMREILTETRFDDLEQIGVLISQMQISNRTVCVTSGHAVALADARAHFDAASAAGAYLAGTPFVRFLGDAARLDAADLQCQAEFMEGIEKQTVCKSRLVLSLTAPEMHDLTAFVSALPQGAEIPRGRMYTANLPLREAVTVPAQIGYAITASRTERPYDASWHVAETILSLGYLWNQVRVQGGAYGAGLRVSRRGSVSVYSYRDPTPLRSLDIYRGMADALEAAAGEDIEQYIISTLAKDEPLMTPEDEGLREDIRYFTAHTEEMRKEAREQILNTNAEALKKAAAMLREVQAHEAVCVIAPEAALQDAQGFVTVSLN